MMKYYFENADEVLNNFASCVEGLSPDEAAKRLKENGKNVLVEGKRKSLVARFVKQLVDPMIIVLLVAALLSGITAVYSGESFADVFIILIVVVLNSVLGVYQESKAEKAIEALQKMSASTSKVLRGGKIFIIKSEELVVGDIILLEAGDAVPADGRIIEEARLEVEEAALTGESVASEKTADKLIDASGSQKDAPLGDRNNMVYMGCTVVYGRGKAVVTDTGMNTEMGKIAESLTQAKEEETPLQKKLLQLSKVLTYSVSGICVFIFLFKLFMVGSLSSKVVIDSFMIAISLAVAAIPEGLVAVVTIVLAIGVTNMSKRNAIIRKLTAVETLGCAQIICSDKTGTLTQNLMTVTEHFSSDEIFLAKALALCCDATLDTNNKAIGEPTECALVNYAYRLGIDVNGLGQDSPRVNEAPFDSVRKMMSTVHTNDAGSGVTGIGVTGTGGPGIGGAGFVEYTKGAPDEVIKICTHFLKNGEVLPLTDEDKKVFIMKNKYMAGNALRVLGAAYKEFDLMPAEFERDMIFIGLVGIIDPIRPEAFEAIAECKTAGIRPIMITGDHKDTAIAIAKELGLITDESEVLTGAELDEISDEEFEKTIGSYSVYARVKPENKVRIVEVWQKNGFICAMTGDGVNDAPSIKRADIGVGMGITGTDVTKNVADMVLADDNFATIVGAVGEGRKIFDNIKKTIQFLLSSNLSEVFSIFIATLLGFVILRPVHILWINLITDAFPALALGMEKGEADIMKRNPRNPKESMFANGLGIDVIWQGIMVTVVTLTAYFVGHFIESGRWEIVNSADGITMAFLTMSMAEIFHSFNLRSTRKSIFSMKKQNFYLWGSMVLSLFLTTIVIYVPFFRDAFEFEQISTFEYFVAMALAISVIPIVEIVKLVRNSFNKK